jgi:hypothetical protein
VQLRNNPHYEPIAAAAALANRALQDARAPTEEPATAAAAAAEYYMPVLREVMASALQRLLQVRGTADGLCVYLPGGLAKVVYKYLALGL